MLRIVMWGLLLLGIGILGLSVVIFNVTTQGVDNPQVASMVEGRFCGADETVISVDGPRVSTHDNPQASFISTLVYCEAANGTRRDITPQYAMFIMPMSGVPFVIGMILVLGTVTGIAFDSRRRRTRALMHAFTPQGNVEGVKAKRGEVGGAKAKRGDVPPDAQAVFDQVFAHLENLPQATVITTGGSTSTLAERLQQLEKAREMGLITEAEYERARTAILDQFDD